MTLIATQGLWLPHPPLLLNNPTISTGLLIDATGEIVAFVGRVWNKDRTSKDITKVGFRFGSVTKAGGSGLTVSLQDVDLANGPVMRPDGTPDQTVAIANGNAAFASNTWIQTAALSANRTVTFGERLAVVIEYDGSGRQGADSVIVSTLSASSTAISFLNSGPVLFAAAAWSAVANIGWNNVILEFSDGTFGTLDYGLPFSATSSTAYNSGSASDEIALRFQVPFECKCEGAWVLVSQAASADFDVVLYEGTTPIASATVDSNATAFNSAGRAAVVTWPEITLAPNTTYYLSVKPTTANSVTFYDHSVNAANHFQAHAGGVEWQHAARVDAGAWDAPTTTKRPFAGIRLSAVHDGSGSGVTARVIGG